MKNTFESSFKYLLYDSGFKTISTILIYVISFKSQKMFRKWLEILKHILSTQSTL